MQATNNMDSSGLIGFNVGEGETVNLEGSGTIHAGDAVRIGVLDTNPGQTYLALANVPAGIVNISTGLTIGNQIQTNGFIPPPPVPPSPTPDEASSVRIQIAFLGQSSSEVFLPSLTATDQTQFFGFTNFNLELDEWTEDDLDGRIGDVRDPYEASISGTTVSAFNFGRAEINRLARDGVIVAKDSGKNYLDLQNGNILVMPDRNVLVSTGEGKINIEAGAMVFIIKSGGNVIVYDLAQTKPRQVYVTVDKQKVVLGPGNMLAVTKHNIDSLQSLPVNCHAVAYSPEKSVLSKGNVKVFTANFSISSALSNIQPLTRLTSSKYAEDKSALEKLWKGAQIQADLAQSFENVDPGR